MAYDDNGEYIPDADVAGMYEPPQNVPFMGNADGSGGADWLQSAISATTAALAPGYQPSKSGYVEAFGGASNESDAITAGGVATAAGNPLTEGFKSAWDWFNGQKDSTKGAITTLAGSFLAGVMGYSTAQRKIASDERMSEASMLNAQTNAARQTNDAAVQQTKFDNASSIGTTNFGAKPQGLIFRNKLAGRQTRTGYTGA